MNIEIELQKIRDDHYSGSNEILQQYIDLLKNQYIKGDLKSAYDKNFLLKNLSQLQLVHPSFFTVQHFLKDVITILRSGKRDWHHKLSYFLKEYELKWKDINKYIAAKAESYFILTQKTILVHSNSSTIKSLFRLHKPDAKKINLIQTESRPVMEGHLQAEYLSDLGYQVTVIADSAISLYTDKIDMALLGADAIGKDFFINKIGSHLIALVCQESGIPLYVLADSRKLWINQGLTDISIPAENPKPENELWDNPPAGVHPENFYFDSTPNKRVDLFITESEAITGKEIKHLKTKS